MALLHGIPPANGTALRLCLHICICLQLCLQSHYLRHRRDLREHASMLRSFPLPRQLSDVIPVIVIGSFVLVTGSDSIQLPRWNSIRILAYDSIWLTVYELIWLPGSDLIWIAISYLIWLIVSDLIWLTVFDLIWLRFFDWIQLMFNILIFNLSHIIRVPYQSGFREYHIGQSVFEIIQHWNRGIFHNYENSNLFWQ